MSTISGELDPTARALLDPVLAKWARPGMNNPDDPESPSGDAENPSIDREALVAAEKPRRPRCDIPGHAVIQGSWAGIGVCPSR
ncbi:hypothetical protein Pd630_LPD02929 [Rhodococcus opacus PD630]|nr:hypothetical protein Pd630_LPD02929 [Rhodococcus opacus PD630]